MTLIATSLCRATNSPVMIGDILLTSTLRFSDGLSLPFIKNLDEKFLDHKVTGGSQKVVVVSPQIAFAWTGFHKDAVHLYNSLKVFWEASIGISPTQFSNFCENFDAKSLSDLGFVVYFICDDKELGIWSNLAAFDLNGLEALRVGGSGTQYFIQTLEQNQLSMDPKATEYELLIGRMIATIGTATSEQILKGSGIVDGWGGGFEIVTCYNGEFQKQNNILWVKFRVQTTGEDAVVEAMADCQYQCSNGDHTQFLSVDCQSGALWHHVISPPGQVFNGQIERPSMMKPELAICLVLVDGRRVIFSDIRRRPIEEEVRLHFIDGALAISFSEVFLDRFFSCIAGITPARNFTFLGKTTSHVDK